MSVVIKIMIYLGQTGSYPCGAYN